ncbi:hypothetical protein [Aminobacter anthyllidis]|uniref:hypothetical protein n=1 Tax=Aminobacter anthyllidis TaxID=1035067 RepID=UPI003B75C087
MPEQDNELLKSAHDIGNWLNALGLADARQAKAIASITGDALVEGSMRSGRRLPRSSGPSLQESLLQCNR